jgi:MSHA biogenesis protein MshO
MISVIAIMAIIGAAVAVFLRYPLQSYQDAQRRAAITDAADTAFLRLRRDLQTALPNSVRVTNNGVVFYLEFLPMRTAGRYRAESPSPTVPATDAPDNTCDDVAPPAGKADGLADENVLQFGVPDDCFTTLGNLPDRGTITSSDFVVVYNLGPGFTNADAYAGGNSSQIASVAPGAGGKENVVRFNTHTFNLESPGRRFQIIAGPVSYVCDPGAGILSRVSGYPISLDQPKPAGGIPLAQGITACTMTYDVVNQRNSIVSIWLRFADPGSGTAVNLFQQVQLNNVP